MTKNIDLFRDIHFFFDVHVAHRPKKYKTLISKTNKKVRGTAYTLMKGKIKYINDTKFK